MQSIIDQFNGELRVTRMYFNYQAIPTDSKDRAIRFNVANAHGERSSRDISIQNKNLNIELDGIEITFEELVAFIPDNNPGLFNLHGVVINEIHFENQGASQSGHRNGPLRISFVCTFANQNPAHLVIYTSFGKLMW